MHLANDEHAVGGGSSEVPPPSNAYTVLPQWHSKKSNMRVICVGAGSGGLLLAYKMQKLMTDFELTCYEKNPEVGGTWYENRYPGCACDIPAHAYVYPFEPNPEWSSFYAYAPEILKYFKRFAEKYDLMRHVKLSTRVLSAIWDEEKGIYDVTVEHNGEVTHDWCHVLVNGTGFLNDWKWPQISGLHDFKGQLLHSAAWDPDVTWENKTVAVIGTGSSAIQIVPQVQKTASKVVAFMRSPTWISPAGSLQVLKKWQDGEAGESAETKEKQEGAQYWFTDADKQKLRDDPEYHLAMRKELDGSMNATFQLFVQGSAFSKGTRQFMEAEMLRRLGPGNEDLKEQLIPKWPPGCRRLTPGDGYLEALVKPNVTRVYKNVAEIVPDGLIDETGTLHKADILVCATGFNIAFAPPFVVRGVGGVTMQDEFNPHPIVYLALTVPKFPNFFLIGGVRGNWAAGPLLPSHEAQCDYIVTCLTRMQCEGIKALEVRREPVDQLYEHIDEMHKATVWNDNCKSWYKNNTIGGKLWIWGGSMLHYLKTVREVRWEHYDVRYRGRNMWAFLGMGETELQVKGDQTKLAPYVRNDHDEPWGVL